MITEANIPNLLRCVTSTENAPNFDLGTWVQVGEPCGTYGCLVGNDILTTTGNIRSRHTWHDDFDEVTCLNTLNVDEDVDISEWAMQEYGISEKLMDYLFMPNDFLLRWNGGHNAYDFKTRKHDDRAAALRRLRKVIYYILHKRELMYTDDMKVRETARRQEGDHNVLQQVLAKLEAMEGNETGIEEKSRVACGVGS
jgi:hypothetical protein